MKYLRLVDHNGHEYMRHEVFLDGPNWEWEASQPVAVWLGKIQIVDKIPEPELVGIPDEPLEVKRELEVLEEVASESEEISTESSGDIRTETSDESESLEASSERANGGDTSKRDKRHRKPKTS